MVDTESIDFTYPRDLQEFWENHVDDDTMMTGESEDGELQLLSAVRGESEDGDCVIVTTFQKNGWTRKMYYWLDGTVEEMYDGKWK